LNSYTLLFLYLVLPVSALVYHLMPDIRRKNIALIVMSLLLYTFGQPAYTLLMVALCYVNYRFAFRIDPEERGTLLLPVVLNVGILAGFKYLSVLLGLFDVSTGGFTILPAGLSIFVFSAVSYLADVYQGTVEPEERFSNLLLYFLMFPKLLQGPIVPYSQLSHQLQRRRTNARACFEGFQRFLFGLAKKVLLADACGRLILAFQNAEAENTLVGVWFTAIVFMFRIYYDFSGCCDMAIGLGRIFGFRYCENFKRPYLALSVTEFCSRWNLTLVGFFRTYVYEPLGSNQLGKARQAINMLFCLLLIGLWHSTGLNYLVWAAYFWAVLVVELYLQDYITYWPDWLCRCWTLWLLLFSFILFSREDLGSLKAAMSGILGYGGFSVPGTGRWIFSSLPLLIICWIGVTDLPVLAKRMFAGVCGMDGRKGQSEAISPLRVIYVAVCAACVLGLLWLCTVALATQSPLPSIYGQF
jgi:alginate O-acetyltransferase complex protein AlgI